MNKTNKLVIDFIKNNYNEVLKENGIVDVNIDTDGEIIVSKKQSLNEFLTLLEVSNYTTNSNIITIEIDLKGSDGVIREFNLNNDLSNYLALKTVSIVEESVLSGSRIYSTFGVECIDLDNGSKITLRYLKEEYNLLKTLIKLKDVKRISEHDWRPIGLKVKHKTF